MSLYEIKSIINKTHQTPNIMENKANTMYKHCIGVKKVFAKPMNRKEYNDYRGWTLPADENGADEGYLVEYVEGGKSNHHKHEGYISWSPKDVFEKGYISMEQERMNSYPYGYKPHEYRVMSESYALQQNINKLIFFIASDKFKTIDPKEQELLQKQLLFMQGYCQVLEARIALFEPDRSDNTIPDELFNIGDVKIALEIGKRCARKGWNDKGMFIFRQVPASIPESVVPNMQSLPDSVKNEFVSRFFIAKNHPDKYPAIDYRIHYSNQIAIVYPDNSIHGWSPTVADMLANDWMILE